MKANGSPEIAHSRAKAMMAIVTKSPGQTAWNVLSQLLDGVAATVLFAMMAITFVDVIARYFFNSPIPSSFELSKVMLGMLIFACLPVLSAEREHVTIDLLDKFFAERLHSARIRVVDLISASVLAVMGVVIWIQAGKLAASNVGTEILRIPIGPIAYFMSVMLCLAALVSVIRSISVEKGREID